MTLITPHVGVICHLKATTGLDIVYLCAQFDDSSFSQKYNFEPPKFKMGHVSHVMPLLTVISDPYAGTLYSLSGYKIGSL